MLDLAIIRSSVVSVGIYVLTDIGVLKVAVLGPLLPALPIFFAE